ncbi:lysophospholipid acyltransferase LPEAT1-like isoform X3 [Syzygium oleosum]|uniref:lysophospholipid acyltransferase LPEAT1-like isoform X3 n=1 Tax=Syzygium oleosum TaxID=219896 RepID=UPI0024B8B6E9|nr:lysophospholipid acyltransferase LPEAT1-like isoform X3 [Syzygium oleosum]
MESELKDLSSPAPAAAPPPRPASAAADKDDRPLLKLEPEPEPEAGAEAPAITPENLAELEKRFAAYVRRDAYGSMGRGELPLGEKLLLGVAMATLVPVRVVAALAILVAYYLICRACTLLKAPNREEEGEQEDYAHMGGWRRKVIVACGRVLSRAMLFVMGFYWIDETFRGASGGPEKAGKEQHEEHERPGAIVSNHVSYVDILYHMSSSFPSFVAKWLNFLWLVSSGVITERVREAHQNKDAPMMMLFPEGTTTNGDYLLPFKTGAFLAKAPVLPVILNYPYQRFSPAWDSISGVRHVIFLLCQFVNHIEVTHLPVYYPSEQEKGDAKLYANNVRRLMAKEGHLILSDIGLAEKRVYHAALNGNNSLPSVLHQKED